MVPGDIESIVGAILAIVTAALAEKYEGWKKIALWITFVLSVIGIGGVQIHERHSRKEPPTLGEITEAFDKKLAERRIDAQPIIPKEKNPSASEIASALAAKIPPRIHLDSPDPFREFNQSQFIDMGQKLLIKIKPFAGEIRKYSASPGAQMSDAPNRMEYKEFMLTYFDDAER